MSGFIAKIVLAAAGILALVPMAGCSTRAEGLNQTDGSALVEASSDRPFLQVETIGLSVQGRPIQCETVGAGEESILVIATIHGDEPAGTPLVRRLATELVLEPELLGGRRIVMVPLTNPDGMALGTRRNARGVDLNRNFPAENWRGRPGHGAFEASEPETQVLMELIERERPVRIITIHQPLACVDYDGPAEALAKRIAAASDLPVRKLGARAGSLGSWAGEMRGAPVVTIELRRGDHQLPDDELWRRYGPMLLASIAPPGSDPTPGGGAAVGK